MYLLLGSVSGRDRKIQSSPLLAMWEKINGHVKSELASHCSSQEIETKQGIQSSQAKKVWNHIIYLSMLIN